MDIIIQLQRKNPLVPHDIKTTLTNNDKLVKKDEFRVSVELGHQT